MKILFCLASTFALLSFVNRAVGGELAPPVPVLVGEAPIDIAREGHAAPWFGDFDGDARKDLLVGEFREGRCRVYPNQGTNQSPRFEDFHWFEAGGELGRVPVD